MNNGWVAVHRKLLDWEWWDDHNTTRLFLYLLLKANHEEKRWKGIEIKRGQLVTGLHALKKATGISVRSLRTSLKRLESTNEITRQTTSKFSLITITNYGDYQDKDNKTTSKTTSKVTSKRQASDKQVTTNNNNKQLNNENKITNIRSKDIEILSNVDMELKEIREHYNKVYNKSTTSTAGYKKNYKETWRKQHSVEKIKLAISNSINDKWWKDKLDLTVLFRLKNQRGENVDYIEKFANMKVKPNQLGSIALT